MRKVYVVFFVFVMVPFFLLTNAVAEVKGDLSYEKGAVGVFKGKLKASGLKPNQKYVLTLNGWANHPSNKVLGKKCEIWEPTKEGYCDFDKVTTNDKGELDVPINEPLPKGNYKIKFLIKDTSNWAVVWDDTLVKFEVK